MPSGKRFGGHYPFITDPYHRLVECLYLPLLDRLSELTFYMQTFFYLGRRLGVKS
jgi:hypothetical protein